ncbi:MAG TPA: tRNA (guanosine(37)-N1)-methyltransferase TrmD [Bacteroidota bacterium]|jgi:tRNA (guanine37-N1)-methyltransferase|nr:tRNA (guanosine(37)-N1)-methyltransferase TrmD [Bacteroidota bacterium]
MRIDIVTGLPRLLESPFQESILKRAQENKIVEIVIHDLREFTHDKHRTIDDTPYGGGAGMILKPEPFFECVDLLKSQRKYDEIIFLSADGEIFTQKLAIELSLKQNIMLLCGHYKGVDQRVRDGLATREISIGQYVLTGGELPAAVIVDAMVRLIPGAIHDGESALSDSFVEDLVGSPMYTRPPEYRGLKVPDVLLSGDHDKIEKWRMEQRIQRTEVFQKQLEKKK